MLEWGSRGLEYESHAFKNIMLLESGINSQKCREKTTKKRRERKTNFCRGKIANYSSNKK